MVSDDASIPVIFILSMSSIISVACVFVFLDDHRNVCARGKGCRPRIIQDVYEQRCRHNTHLSRGVRKIQGWTRARGEYAVATPLLHTTLDLISVDADTTATKTTTTKRGFSCSCVVAQSIRIVWMIHLVVIIHLQLGTTQPATSSQCNSPLILLHDQKYNCARSCTLIRKRSLPPGKRMRNITFCDPKLSSRISTCGVL